MAGIDDLHDLLRLGRAGVLAEDTLPLSVCGQSLLDHLVALVQRQRQKTTAYSYRGREAIFKACAEFYRARRPEPG